MFARLFCKKDLCYFKRMGSPATSGPSGGTVILPYPEIFKGLPFGMVVLRLEDPHSANSFRVVDLNPAASEILELPMENLRGRTFAESPKLLQTRFPEACLAALRAREPRDLGEISYEDERIRQGVYSVRLFPISEILLGVVFEDITERKHAEQVLRENEERSPLLTADVLEYAIFRLDSLGHVVSWNAGAQRLKGYRTEEIIGKDFSMFYPAEDISSGKPQHNLREAEQHGQSVDEGWRVRKDGSRFWASVVLTALRDTEGNLLGFAKVTRDMSERREKEEALTKAKELLELRVEQRTAVLTRVNQELRTEIAERERAEEQLKASLELLRALAARLQSVREEERTYIAREIHDEFGQICTAIKMDLALIRHKATKRQTRLLAKVDSAVHLVDHLIATLRRIASELRPGSLDDLGLLAALEWQAHEFEKRTGIQCRIILPAEAIALDSERSTAVFRIFQETLTNVMRHAGATTVEARLEREGGKLVLQIHDNGRGFDPEAAKASKSLGLVGMQERALLINSEFRIDAAPGAGTTVTLRIPTPLGGPEKKESG
jgi:PAS domain S-box-containing protein